MSDDHDDPVAPVGATEAASGSAPAGEPRSSAAPAPADLTASASAAAHPRRNPGLFRAFRSGRPVRGTIVGVVKGGYEVQVERARGFCPHSQIALEREDHPEQQVGQRYAFRVTQVRRGGEDVVLSRRALLEEERADLAKAVRATLVEGAVIQGHVAGIADFGAFIDLGAGVMGLAHISELSHDRVGRVSDAVKVGETVQAKILKVSEGTGKISLSLRQARKDPWTGIAERYGPGTTHRGTIRRIAEFGAFVELEPGVEALAPASEFPPAASGWKAGLELGRECDWLVLAVDPDRRRLSLSLPADTADAGVPLESGAEIVGVVQRVERYGVFVWLRPGKAGLLPAEWAGLPDGSDLRRRFGVGQKVEVRVVEGDDRGRRIRLARKGVEIKVEPDPPPAERQAKAARPPAEAPTSFGTILGDKLRAALSGKADG